MSGNEEKQKKKGMFGRLFGGNKSEETVDAAGPVISSEETAASLDEAPVIKVDQEDVLSQSTEPVDVGSETQSGDTTVTEAQPEKKGWFSRLTSGLAKSSSKLTEGITSIFTKSKLDDVALQDLEDLLIQSDLGVATAMKITDELSSSRYDKEITGEEVREILSKEISSILTPVAQPLVVSDDNKPHILLMVGVNGAGKTTSIGKLAKKFSTEGKSVMLAAGDTFRAAAVDQLKVWSERTGAEFVSGQIGSDASGLVYDALEKAKTQQTDILMIDTAGRLQNKSDLMAELEKIVRVIKKFDPSGPHDVLLTLDATTGQNALNQVEIFQKIAGVTGLIMTKLDGTARGGILVAIAEKYKLPIHAIGVGESIEDMQAFNPSDFAKAIAGITE
ncbi:MAG: signal recognition particle-docking protein FtsY [Rhizobiales bacterium]|nr:signal recognition particle-docking protein FtsY [Hyphomicrobiales bacterium]